MIPVSFLETPHFWSKIQHFSGFQTDSRTRLTPSGKAAIQRRAKKARADCLGAMGKEIVQLDGLDEILPELKPQGRNLDQLAALANMGRINVV